MAAHEPIPYGKQWLDEADIEAVVEVLCSDWLTQGPKVDEFERRLAERCGAKHAVAVSSGTAALHLACLAASIGPGDEVVTSPMTFVASANCVLYVGAEPVFADVQPDTLNLDPARLRTALTERTRAIIPVHFAGHPCDMEEIAGLARARGITVIEDACHALGAEYRGSPVGACAYSDMTVFSFHPVKHATTGEGGAVLTNNPDLDRRLRMLRTHGITNDPALFLQADRETAGPWYYELQELGFNYRITDIQCALGLSQLGKLDQFLARRAEIAALYRRLLGGVDGLTLPCERDYVRHAWHIFPVRLTDTDTAKRKRIFERLRGQGIGVQVHYIPVHLQPLYRQRFSHAPGDFPNAERYYAETVTIPLFPKMRDEDAERVADALANAL